MPCQCRSSAGLTDCDECAWCWLQGDTPLHWPLINSDHMRTKLAKRELEKKKIEDAHRCAAQSMQFGAQARERVRPH